MERKGTGKLRVINDQKVFDYFINEKRGTKKEIAQKTKCFYYDNRNYLK